MPRVIPFTQRFRTGSPSAPLDKEVPETARIGFVNILGRLIRRDFLYSWFIPASEALMVGRHLRQDFDDQVQDEDIFISIIKELRWDRFYILCEKIYGDLQTPQEGEETSVDGQILYTDAINELMAEENLAYEFRDGIFQRQGRPQTQRSLQNVSSVLADPRFVQARNHYNKAVKFFNERPNPDVQNCVKESVCALEAFAEIIFGKKAGKGFDEVIRSKQGNAEGKIPPSIGESIIRLRAFRGNAQGVAHAALEGGFVGVFEAELTLSLVASYITYLNDRFTLGEDEIPF